jgi:hypothetical protein
MKVNKHVTVRGTRARLLGAVGLLAGVFAITFTGVATAGTSGVTTAPMVITLAKTLPSMPVPGASLAAWQNYAAQENSALESGATSITFEGQACPLDSFAAVPEGTGALQAAGVPNGVSLEGFAFTLGNCDVNVSSSTSSSVNTNNSR